MKIMADDSTTVKILLADDHPLTRAGIAEFLRRESSFDLVAEAEDGTKAWELLKELEPDIALLDIRMPGMDGVSVAQKAKAEHSPAFPGLPAPSARPIAEAAPMP